MAGESERAREKTKRGGSVAAARGERGALEQPREPMRAEPPALRARRSPDRMPKRRREALPDLARELSAEELVRLTGAHISTARRWRQHGTMPPVISRALSLVQNAGLGALHAEWQGWRVTEEGTLVSPEGWDFTPGDLRATRVLQRKGTDPATDFDREREREALAREAVLTDRDRAENVNTLVRLDRFVRRIRKEIRRATERLHPAEQERLWWESGARERALENHRAAEQLRAELGPEPIERIAQECKERERGAA